MRYQNGQSTIHTSKQGSFSPTILQHSLYLCRQNDTLRHMYQTLHSALCSDACIMHPRLHGMIPTSWARHLVVRYTCLRHTSAWYDTSVTGPVLIRVSWAYITSVMTASWVHHCMCLGHRSPDPDMWLQPCVYGCARLLSADMRGCAQQDLKVAHSCARLSTSGKSTYQKVVLVKFLLKG